MFDKKKYDEYLDEHIENVKKAYDLMIKEGIFDKDEKTKKIIENHDKSKYDKEEYDAYGEYFYGDKDEEAFNYAWLRHQRLNPHHWQYWLLKEDDSKDLIPMRMPLEYVQEMICDWLAFSIKSKNLKEIQEWYKSNKSKQILHEDTRTQVEEYLNKIKELEEMKEIFNLD